MCACGTRGLNLCTLARRCPHMMCACGTIPAVLRMLTRKLAYCCLVHFLSPYVCVCVGGGHVDRAPATDAGTYATLALSNPGGIGAPQADTNYSAVEPSADTPEPVRRNRSKHGRNTTNGCVCYRGHHRRICTLPVSRVQIFYASHSNADAKGKAEGGLCGSWLFSPD